MAQYECECCHKKFRRRPVFIRRTKYHRIVCKDPDCFRKLMRWIALKRTAQKKGHQKVPGA